MNMLMAGMIPVMRWSRSMAGGPVEPTEPLFWFIMSMALLVGFIVAYPINWWLVANHLKHGMMTVRPAREDEAAQGAHSAHAAGAAQTHGNPQKMPPVSGATIALVTVLTFAALAIALYLSP